MLNYNEILPRKFIEIDGEPYEVLSSHVFRKQQRKPVNQTKLKHLVTGKVMERSFHQSERVDEADIEITTIKYLYTNRGESWFSEKDDPSKRFSLPEDMFGNSLQFIKQNSFVDALLFQENVIGIRPPIKVELKVTEAAPAVRGNTAQGATKQVVVETDASVTVPLFINEGDILRINTETGEYTERVEKG